MRKMAAKENPLPMMTAVAYTTLVLPQLKSSIDGGELRLVDGDLGTPVFQIY